MLKTVSNSNMSPIKVAGKSNGVRIADSGLRASDSEKTISMHRFVNGQAVLSIGNVGSALC